MESPSFVQPHKGFLKELFKAYSDSTGRKLDITLIRLSARCAIINAFQTDIKRVLTQHSDKLSYKLLNSSDEVLDYRTTHKLLTGNGSNLSQKNRRKITDYILYSKTQSFKKPSTNFNGAYLINKDFKASKSKKIIINIIDFYTAKSNPDIQWAGVFKGYDVKRSIFDKLKTIAYTAFTLKNSKVSAIVTGPSGSGKTTVLRRLCAEFMKNEKVKILWIYDVSEFRFESILNSPQNYLIIIDDWSKVEKTKEAKQRFLNNISECTNIRLIIGDYFLRDEIEDLLYGKNILDLSSSNNKDVVKDIIYNVPVWKSREHDILALDKKLFNAPLFIVLFVIANKFSDNIALDFDDFEAEFKKIIKFDLKDLLSKYRAIGLAVCYWACLYNEYELYITWEVLLKLAKTYDGNFNIPNSLRTFDKKNPLVRILSNYVSLTPCVIPAHSDENLMEFNHNTLEESFSNFIRKEHGFDDDTKMDLLNRLMDINAHDFGIDLYYSLNRQDFFNLRLEQKETIIQQLTASVGEPFSWHMKLSDTINTLYSDFKKIDETLMMNYFFDIIFFLSISEASKRECRWIKEIVTKLLAMGCKSEFVSELQSLVEDDHLLSKYVWKMYDLHRDAFLREMYPDEFDN